MHKVILTIFLCLHIIGIHQLQAQDLRFKNVLNLAVGQVYDIAQDQQGFIWMATNNQGLQRFDGVKLKLFQNDIRNPNSIASGGIFSLCVTSDNIIWMGMMGAGLEKFDPLTNRFTHFRHNPNDESSVNSDTVTSVMEDHLGNLWMGTSNGLDLLDRKTGKFSHYINKKSDSNSLGEGMVFKVFEDKKGIIWISTTILVPRQPFTSCTLNKFDRVTGKFTRYVNNPSNPKSSPPNLINNIYEDSKGDFWITTLGLKNELIKMDRSTGEFTRYYPDPMQSGPLSSKPPTQKIDYWINFIQEDLNGALWVGLGNSGLMRYDPETKLSSHFGYLYDWGKFLSAKDTVTGFTSLRPYKAINSRDGLFWVASVDGSLFTLNYNKTTLPFFGIKQQEANTLYCEPDDKFLWIATDNGLLRRDLTTLNDKVWVNDPTDNNSLSMNTIWALKPADDGKLWVGTAGRGLDKFDPLAGKFIHYRHDPSNPNSVASNIINNMFVDHQQNLWLATDSGISRMDATSDIFKNYKYRYNDSNSIIFNNNLSITEDNDHYIWAGSDLGVSRLDIKSGKFKRYRFDNSVNSVYLDSKGVLWAGGAAGLFYFDKTKDKFVVFANQQSLVSVENILGIIEDNQHNLWISGASAIFKVNVERTAIRKYSEAQGVQYNKMGWVDNFKAKDGRLFLGHYSGYFSFYPDKINDSIIPPKLLISSFKLSDKEINSIDDGILNAPLYKATEIKLNYDQNVFSFDFQCLDYITPGDEKYLFMLENYDNNWHDIGSDHRAFFFNVPPGTYNFKVKAVSGDGGTVEKTVRIIISPPWYKSWWAYLFYALFIAIVGYMIYKYQKRYIINRERQRTQQKELEQAKEIEKAYMELKATQAQLIQSEKMASLGELTAGIAHEIQNPLNFVNNFSDVNKELLVEMKEEMNKGNLKDAIVLADDVIANEEKINHHGKRADSIVKGMLQHSRSGSGVKEATDINNLLDECLRLSFHGMRAKDKSFNAITDISVDNSLPWINIVSQDISRVLLNLLTNSFYSVLQKKKALGDSYQPRVEASTSKEGKFIKITIKDNGNGIPQKVVDKIFQPFFTTKPTGEGTGLGLSLSYDIITKGHGGEIVVNTKEGEFAEFVVKLPLVVNG